MIAVRELLKRHTQMVINLAYIASVAVQQANFFGAIDTQRESCRCEYTKNNDRNNKHMGNCSTECCKCDQSCQCENSNRISQSHADDGTCLSPRTFVIQFRHLRLIRSRTGVYRFVVRIRTV